MSVVILRIDIRYEQDVVYARQRARRMLRSVKPAAIILDVMLPDEDGWQPLADFKLGETTRDIPILVVSEVAKRAKGLELGAEDYAVKPVARDWLIGKRREVSQRVRRRKLLIIDDDQVARYILKSHLTDTKYQVLETADGPLGLQLADAERPDVIVLDLTMAGMDGYQVLQKLKIDPRTRDIPVIINTSKAFEEKERRDLDKLVLTVLSKEATLRDAAIRSLRRALRKAARMVEAGNARSPA